MFLMHTGCNISKKDKNNNSNNNDNNNKAEKNPKKLNEAIALQNEQIWTE